MTPFDLTQELLAFVAAELQTNGVPVPARRYVAHNRPAGDPCEELVVWVDPIRDSSPVLGTPIPQTTVRFWVSLVFTHPVGSAHTPVPSTQVLTGAAQKTTVAGWWLWRALQRSQHEVFGRCERVVVLDLVPEGPQGGFAWWTGSVETTFNPL